LNGEQLKCLAGVRDDWLTISVRELSIVESILLESWNWAAGTTVVQKEVWARFIADWNWTLDVIIDILLE